MTDSLRNEFTRQIESNRGIIFKVLRLYVNRGEDEKDLYQEIVYQAWKSYPRFAGQSKFSTWLYKVSLNTVLTFKRRPLLVETREVLESKEVVTNDRQEDSEMLYRAITELNEIDRMIITLHLDGYDNDEIADVSGLTKNHVAVKLHRIKDGLVKKLREEV